MHYYALVEIPAEGGDVSAAVSAAMEPHEENDNGGIWDWWTIGGRYTGWLDDYDPTTDRRNMKVCWLCHGTGRREDDTAEGYRRVHPGYGCNGCNSTGIEIKYPTDWVKHPGDIASRSSIPDDKKPHTLIIGGKAIEREYWDGDAWINNEDALAAAWVSIPPDTVLAVVDYHC